ncbi:MAG: sugar phosphate isomerase/epimerase [Candidatus Solibacter usitatus]|nr:sugar phosphate isomerase/epimerase [Candidatus Solibacter usitatus]
MTRRHFLSAAAVVTRAPQAAPARTSMGLTPDAYAILRPARTALEFMETAYAAGAGGVQATLASFEPAYLKQVRARAEQLGMYFELLAPLPQADTSQFEAAVRAAKEAGATSIRSVCLSGRRYETFNSLEQWNAFAAESKARLARAVPIVEKHKLPLGIENHKDWTAAEMPGLLKSYSSEYLGACIDFGNNISLLDDPMELVEALAPFVINTHIKDMGVEEYQDGFLLSEVPLGQGILDLKRMVALLQAKRPGVTFSLDMLTRDPLKITCLTDKYWLTFPERNGRYLARALAMVRANKPRQPLPRVTGLEREAQLRLEAGIIAECVAYARDHLNLRV